MDTGGFKYFRVKPKGGGGPGGGPPGQIDCFIQSGACELPSCDQTDDVGSLQFQITSCPYGLQEETQPTDGVITISPTNIDGTVTMDIDATKWTENTVYNVSKKIIVSLANVHNPPTQQIHFLIPIIINPCNVSTASVSIPKLT